MSDVDLLTARIPPPLISNQFLLVSFQALTLLLSPLSINSRCSLLYWNLSPVSLPYLQQSLVLKTRPLCTAVESNPRERVLDEK